MKSIINPIAIFLLACCFYSSEIILFLFLFSFYIITCLINHVNKFKVLLVFLIGLIYLYYVVYVNHTNSFDFIFKWINQCIGLDIRNSISLYLVKIHGNEIGSFLSLILLNIKNSYNYGIYYKLIDLSIVYLIVVGGFHINLLCFLFSKIFYKWPKFAKCVSLLISFLVSYLNGFSVASIRFFFASIFGLFKNTNSFRNNLALISIGLIAPYTLISIGFCMSYLGTRGINTFTKLHGHGKLYDGLISSLFATVYIIPFLAIMNDSISLWGVFFGLLFTPLFIVLYFLSFFFAWFSFSTNLFFFFYQLIYQISTMLIFVNVLVPISYLNNKLLLASYYSCLEIVNYVFLGRRSSLKWKLKMLERMH